MWLVAQDLAGSGANFANQVRPYAITRRCTDPSCGVPVRAMAGDMWHIVILTQGAARRNPLRESFHTVCMNFASNPGH